MDPYYNWCCSSAFSPVVGDDVAAPYDPFSVVATANDVVVATDVVVAADDVVAADVVVGGVTGVVCYCCGCSCCYCCYCVCFVTVFVYWSQ